MHDDDDDDDDNEDDVSGYTHGVDHTDNDTLLQLPIAGLQDQV